MKRIFVTAIALSLLAACNNDSSGTAAGDSSTMTDMNNANTTDGTAIDTMGAGNAAGSGMSTGTDTSLRTNNLGGSDTATGQGSGASTTNGSGAGAGTSGSSSGSSNSGSGGTRPSGGGL